jgi:uncharacterized membrane protein
MMVEIKYVREKNGRMFTHINNLPGTYYIDNHVSAFQRRFQCLGWNRKNSFCVRLSGTKCVEELKDYISRSYKIDIDAILVAEEITSYQKAKGDRKGDRKGERPEIERRERDENVLDTFF